MNQDTEAIGQTNLKDERNQNEVLMDMHGKVLSIMKDMQKVVDEFFAKEDEALTQNEKFLIASRAINIHGKKWYENFFIQFDPEKKFEEMREKAWMYDQLNK
jgi:hypothetical protein